MWFSANHPTFMESIEKLQRKEKKDATPDLGFHATIIDTC